MTQEFGVDHAMLVPLHYLTDGITTPVVPIWVNTFVKPLPTAQRCYALGRMLRSAIDSLPRQAAGRGDRHRQLLARDRRAEDRSRQAQRRARHRLVEARPSPASRRRSLDELVEEATPERMWKAGNIGGELLNWIVTLGVIGKDKPRYIADHDEKDGHAYAVWRWN